MDNNQGNNNFRLFLKRLRARLRPLDPETRFPVEEGWQELKTRIAYEDEALRSGEVFRKDEALRSGEYRKSRVFPLKYRYAAAVLLVMLTGGLYWALHSGHVQEQAGSQTIAGSHEKGEKAILPPSQGVQLVLSDGRKVPVGQRQTLSEQGGVAIQTDSGKVEYLKGPEAGPGRPAKQEEIAYNTLEVPRGNKSRITLPDGTKVWVNAASRLKYPTVFAGERREVELEGEAYLEVSQDAAHPFIVHAGKMDIQVLGTEFNVNTYETVFFTTLVRGKVSVNEKTGGKTEPAKGKTGELILNPGEQAALNSTEGGIRKSTVNTADFTAWKEDHLYIGNCGLDKVTTLLGREFDYDIILADPSLKQLHFTIDMPAPRNLQEVLEHLCSTTERLQFSITGRTVTLSRAESGSKGQ